MRNGRGGWLALVLAASPVNAAPDAGSAVPLGVADWFDSATS